MEQIPREAGESGRSGTQMMRYREGLKMGSVMTDPCVKNSPGRRCRQTPVQPESAYPIRLRKVGLPCHFSAVAASSGATLRTPNAAVTKNSTDIGRGSCGLTAWRARAGAHVTTPLRSPVTRAASERGKVGATLQADTLLLSVPPACGASGGCCCGPQGLSRLGAPIGAARNIN